MSDLIYFIVLIVPLGALAGFFAGLFGIGGGLIIVPALYYIFLFLGYDPSVVMHMAVGTSIATIIPTGLSSSYAHFKKGAIDFIWCRSLVFGLVFGALIGSIFALSIDGSMLKTIFGVLLLGLAILMLRGKEDDKICEGPLSHVKNNLFGVFSGVCSALIGIGGATFNVPYMLHHGVRVNKAIATASLLGLSISIPASCTFMLGAQSHSVSGYIHGPALLFIIIASVPMAQIGARLTHKLPVQKLKYGFIGFLVATGLKMIAF